MIVHFCAYIAHCRAALDRVYELTGVCCGPLDHGAAEAPAEMISEHELLRYMAAAERAPPRG